MRHWIKCYWYEDEGGAVKEAWENWKGVYNASLCLTYGEFSFTFLESREGGEDKEGVKSRFRVLMMRSVFLALCSGSFLALAWKCFRLSDDWTVGGELVRYTLGLVSRNMFRTIFHHQHCELIVLVRDAQLLIGLHVWSAQSTYEVLGNFGWFYGKSPSHSHSLPSHVLIG